MKKVKVVVFGFVILSALIIACNQKAKNTDSIVKGTTTIYVDETLTPIVEDQVAVFESEYDAKLKMVSQSEIETVNSLFNQKSAIAVLSRKLTNQELKVFDQKKITPRITGFATDAIAFITNKNNKDTLIALDNVIQFMQGKTVAGIKGLVFDNPNSSTVRYMNALAGIQAIPKKNVYSFKTNQEVIKYVAKTNGMIGIVGLNWLTQPSPTMQEVVDNITVLSIKGLKSDAYYDPTQNNIAEGKYPLARDLYIINCQGYSGLGMGFSSFVAGDIGQRIILKSIVKINNS
jgi:phosphate transport system substrate-binding protein